MKQLLHRLGFVYKKPKHVPGKLDQEAQAAFVETYEKLRKNKGENDPIIFADACHPRHDSIPARGWIRRGVEKELKSNGGRRRVNIHGAVDIDTMETTTDFAKIIDAESSFRLFKKLAAKYPNAKKIHVIVDNAFSTTNTTTRSKTFYPRAKISSAAGRSTVTNCARRWPKIFTCIRERDGNFKVTRVYLSNARDSTTYAEFARVILASHRVEDCFRRAKSECGLTDYEVQSWLGWHHHITLSLPATFFLMRETLHTKKRLAIPNRAALTPDNRRTTPPSRRAHMPKLAGLERFPTLPPPRDGVFLSLLFTRCAPAKEMLHEKIVVAIQV